MSPQIDLYNADSINLMRSWPSDSFDAVVTDPPYATGGQSSAARAADPVSKYQSSGTKKYYPTFSNDCRDQRTHYLYTVDWMREALRLTREHGWLLCFSDWRQLPLTSDALQVAGWTWRGLLPWDKTEQCRPQLGIYRNQAEYVLVATKGSREIGVRKCPAGVYRTPIRAKDKLHLTGKPIDLMEHLLSIISDGSRILDPFAGSGTTLLAARNLGHSCTGIELSTAYYNIAARRLGVALDDAA